MKSESYQICTRCVMDSSAIDIEFDQDGACSYCSEFLVRAARVLNRSEEARREDLNGILEAVKRHGRNRRYDCVVGVSGGVDSSWVLVKAVELGLRPLAVHMDNGWNSELAQNNIANLVRGLGVDLFTYVIEWEEYRALMQSFFDAHVIDVELLYDNAMLAVNYQQAAKYGIRHILSGSNLATEGVRLPSDWVWLKNDARQIRALAKANGVSVATFPLYGTFNHVWNAFVRRIRWVHLLNVLDYNKSDALGVLRARFAYKPYPYKHYESVFTRFYQGYLLPRKFGVDKRRVHLSSLIMSGQMSRGEAMKKLEESPYPSEGELKEDIEYFLKKMRWAPSDLAAYLEAPRRSHADFPSESALWSFAVALRNRVYVR